MKRLIILFGLLAISISLIAQTDSTKKTGSEKNTSAVDSLLNTMNNDDGKVPVVIFKSTRLILSQSTKTVKKKNFNFLIVHRFGDFAGKKGGGQYFYGLDDIADVTLRFEYGISDNFNIAVERSTIGGLVDFELKDALIQQTGDGSSPVAITVLGESGVRTYSSFNSFGDRLSYFLQAIFAHKFSPEFALQIAPSYLIDNSAYPPVPGIERQFLSLSAAARFKVTNHMGLLLEYAHPFSSFRTTGNGFYDPIGFGFEMETGGHVFTLNVTNSRAGSDINYLSDTESSFTKGQYRLGFTISRMFDFNHKEHYKVNN